MFMKTTIKIGFSLWLFVLLLCAKSYAATSWFSLSFMNTQRDLVISWYDAAYAHVYSDFQKSWAILLQSPNYQSLICLWAMKKDAFIPAMQTELSGLKSDFLNQATTILNSISNLSTNQASDSTLYNKELLVLVNQYSQLLSGSTQKISTFQTKYESTLTWFISQYVTYVKKNQSFLNQITTKLTLLKTIDSIFSGVSASLNVYRLNLTSANSSFFDWVESLKSKMTSALDLSLQTIADVQIKQQRILKDLSWTLMTQKWIVLSQYTQQFSDTYNSFLANWYDQAKFLTLQSRVNALHINYALNNTYQCSLILANSTFDIITSSLLSDLNQFSWSLLVSLSGSVSSGDFQSKVLNWYTVLKSNQNTLLSWYTSFVKNTTQSQLADYKKAHADISLVAPVQEDTRTDLPAITTWSSVNTTGSTYLAPVWFYFSQAYKINQKAPWVKILQSLLTSLTYYSGPINGVYTKATKDAVYRLQLSRGLLKWYEKRPQTWWWMGPATRSALNKIIH